MDGFESIDNGVSDAVVVEINLAAFFQFIAHIPAERRRAP
jgi:hypothetical protein